MHPLRAVLVLLPLLLAACGGGYDCDASGATCDGDTPPAPTTELEWMQRGTALPFGPEGQQPALTAGTVETRLPGAGKPTAYFVLDAPDARRFRFTCKLVTLQGCSIRLYDAQGVKVAEAYSEVWWAHVHVYLRTPGPGRYYLAIGAHTPTGSGTFEYALTNLGADPEADDTRAALPLRVGEPYTGALQSADMDVFRFDVQPDTAYRWRCEATSASRLLGTGLRLPGAPAAEQRDALRTLAEDLFQVSTTAGTATAAVWSALDGSGDGHIPYTCRVDAVADDAPGAVGPGARALTPGVAADGAFEYPGDRDAFVVDVPALRFLRATCRLSTGAVCPVVSVTDPTGASVSAGEGVPVEQFAWTSQRAGAYGVVVTGLPFATYSVKVEVLGEDDVADTVAGAQATTVGPAFEGEVQQPWDVDVFALSAPVGTVAALVCTESLGGEDGLLVELRDARDFTLGGATTRNPMTPAAKVPADGRIFAKVRAPRPGHSALGAYSCTWSTRTDDTGDTPAAAAALGVPGRVEGRFELQDDRDVYRVSLQAGTRFGALCTAGPAVVEGVEPCALELHDAAGVRVGIRLGAHLEHVVQASGSYFLTATGTDRAYTLRTGTFALDAFGSTEATATPVAVGAAVAGYSQAGAGPDVLRFTGTPDRHYRVRVRSPLDDSPSPPVPLRVAVSASGAEDVRVDPDLEGWELSLNVAQATTVYLRLEPGQGPYVLTVEDAGADDHGDTAETATALALDVERSGVLELMADEDVFTVQLAVGTERRVDFYGAGLCRVFPPPGSWMLPMRCDAIFHPDVAGAWSVRITAGDADGSGPLYADGPYTLRVR